MEAPVSEPGFAAALCRGGGGGDGSDDVGVKLRIETQPSEEVEAKLEDEGVGRKCNPPQWGVNDAMYMATCLALSDSGKRRKSDAE